MKKEYTIAIVEDDAPLRNAIDGLLRSSGFKTSLHASALSFLRNISADTDLLITDVKMPVMNGLELQSKLIELGKPLPVIVITALLDDEITRQAFGLGAVACLAKPFDESALLSAIDFALNGKR